LRPSIDAPAGSEVHNWDEVAAGGIGTKSGDRL
jgi:hypothetical protein